MIIKTHSRIKQEPNEQKHTQSIWMKGPPRKASDIVFGVKKGDAQEQETEGNDDKEEQWYQTIMEEAINRLKTDIRKELQIEESMHGDATKIKQIAERNIRTISASSSSKPR